MSFSLRDPPEFCDIELNPLPHERVGESFVTTFRLPQDLPTGIKKGHWRWKSAWEIESNDLTDESGWMYGNNHWTRWKKRSTFMRFTRRRVWKRWAEVVEVM